MLAVSRDIGFAYMSYKKDMGSSRDVRQERLANATSGGCFRAKMIFPPNYPLYPPKMKFETPIFHPNGKLLNIHGRSSGLIKC